MSDYPIKELPDGEKPRERLKKVGPSSLSDSELLALVIRSGTKDRNVLDLCKDILTEFDFRHISKFSLRELKSFRGIGEVKAGQIMAVFELARRINNQGPQIGEHIGSLDDVLNYLEGEMRKLEREELRLLHISNSNELLAEETLFRGSIDQLTISPREIIRSCIRENCKSVIVVHNHPNGSPEPSEADKRVTKKIKSSLQTIEVKLLDHVIIGKREEFSFMREGYI